MIPAIKKIIPILILVSVFGLSSSIVFTAFATPTYAITNVPRLPTRTPEQIKQARNKAAAEGDKKAASPCGVTTFFTIACVTSVVGDFYAWVFSHILIPIASGLLWLAGALLDFAISFSLNTQNFKDIQPITTAWKTIRDLCNVAFIFILLYIAISTILQRGGYQMKQMLLKLVITALLINFSLFTTEVVLDAGNIVAHGYYTSIVSSTPEKTFGKGSLSGAFMNVLNIQSQFNTPDEAEAFIDRLTGSQKFIYVVLNFSVILYTTYIFFRVALIFLGRALAFIFLMIFSPIGFIGLLLPKIGGGTADKWWKTLFDQAMVAPVFMIFMYVILQIMSSNKLGAALSITVDPAAKLGKSFDMAFYTKYIIVIGLLYLAMKITKQVGGEFGSLATKVGITALGVAGGAALAAATRGTAMLARGTVGKLGARVAESEKLKDYSTTGNWLQKGLARSARSVGRYGSKASFDLKESTTFGEVTQAAGLQKGAKVAGLDLSKPGIKGGYEQWVKDKREAEQKKADEYKPSETAQAKKKEELEGLVKKKAEEEKKVKDQQKTEMDQVVKPVEEKYNAQLEENRARQENARRDMADSTRKAEDLKGNAARAGEYAAETQKVAQKQKELATLKEQEEKIKAERSTEVEKTKAEAKQNVSVLTPEQVRDRAEEKLEKLEDELQRETRPEYQAVLKIAVRRAKEEADEISKYIEGTGKIVSEKLMEEMKKVPDVLKKTGEEIGKVKISSIDRREIIAGKIERGGTFSSFFRSKEENRKTAEAIRGDIKKGYKPKGKTEDTLQAYIKALRAEGKLGDEEESAPETPPTPPPTPPTPPPATPPPAPSSP